MRIAYCLNVVLRVLNVLRVLRVLVNNYLTFYIIFLHNKQFFHNFRNINNVRNLQLQSAEQVNCAQI